ncbi:hypothetical protein QYF61_019135 [Mycteria americana]|uniref:Uncharacterized protein n=1 Tax=Mycteria americana TaxID=33587 RepID=A0AAN7N2X9_MYCAM|nr:hypothetical protein QYF61_019135 [Mycteria americana]
MLLYQGDVLTFEQNKSTVTSEEIYCSETAFCRKKKTGQAITRSVLILSECCCNSEYKGSVKLRYRIIERFGLEGTFKDHLVQPPCHGQGHLSLDQVAQSTIQPGLEHFQGGGIHNFSEQSVPVAYHPHCKKFLPYVQSKSTLFQFQTIAPCPITTGLGHNKVSLKPSLLQAEQPQLSQPFFIGEVHVFPVLATPELDPLEYSRWGLTRAEYRGSIISLDLLVTLKKKCAAQDMIGFQGCKCTLLAHIQFFIYKYPQVLLCRATLNPFIPQPVLIPGVASSQVQDLALGLAELHEVHMDILLKPVKVPFLRCINCITQLGVIRKLAEGALNLTIYVIREDVK